MKYSEYQVVFAEVPDEITLAINISGCPNKCPGCHSKHLWEDVGELLNEKSLASLIESNQGISCICFMGGDQNPLKIIELAQFIRNSYPNLKIGWFSGKSALNDALMDKVLVSLDYLKLGPFLKDYGPLNSPNTNQKFYQIVKENLIDITYKFWKHE